MRKNIKNDKVIKAITIGLATMIAATSVPVDLYAADGEEDGQKEQQNGQHEEVTDEAVEAVEDAAEVLVPETPAEAPSEEVVVSDGDQAPAVTLDEAIQSVAALTIQPTVEQPTDGQPVEGDATGQNEEKPAEQLSAVQDLKDAKDLIVKIENKDGLDELKEALVEAGQSENITPVAVSEVPVDVLPTVDDESGSQLDRDNAKNEDGTYNFYDSSKDEGSELIQSFVGDYVDAVQLVKDGKFDQAEEKANNADKKLAADEAKISFLKEAIKDSKAAEQKVSAAEAKLENIKGIRAQYNALMVQHYREIEDKEKKDIAKFKESGELDVVESANALKNAGLVDTYGKGRSETVLKLGRDLIVKLVKAEVESKGGTVVAFGDKYGSSNQRQDACVGEVFINNAGEQQVKILPKDDIYRSNGTDNGRTNSYHLKYKDAEGNEHDKFYNIVYKSNKDKDENGNIDIENGIIYVAEVYQENGVWKTKDIETEFDNFNLYANGSALEKALADVTKAKEEAQNLRIKIEELGQKAGIKNINEMEAELERLESAAAYSRKKLNALLEVIATAPRDSGDDDDDSDGDGGETGGTVIPGPGGFTYTIPGGYTLPSGLLSGLTGTTGGTTTGSGVLGVRTGGGQDETGEGREDEGIAPRADFNTVNKVLGSTQNKKDNQLLKRIKNNEIPLADIPTMDDEVKMNWMWLLIIFLLGATGKKMYDNYMKKAEEAKQNAENK